MLGLFDFSAELQAAHGPAVLAALVCFGFAVGGMTGLFGVGGGFLVTPLLIVVFRIDESTAIGSGLCFIIGTGAAGLSRHWRLGSVEGKAMLIIGGGAMGGAVLGTMLHEFLKDVLGHSGGFDFAALVRTLYLILLPIAAYLAYRKPQAHISGKTPLQRLPVPPRVSLRAAGLDGVSAPGLCVLGVGVGVLTGLLGVGGGVLYMPLLLVLVGLSVHQAVGTSLGVVLLGAIAGTARHAVSGNVNLLIAMALLLGSSFGVQVGAWLCHRMHGTKLRRYFTVVVLLAIVVVAADLAVKIFG